MSELQTPFEALELARGRVESLMKSLPATNHARATKPGAWTALQIAEHLVLGDETVGSARWARSQKPGRSHPVIFAFILAGLRRDVRFPLPSRELEPRGATSWSELQVRWDASRAELRTFLDSLNTSTTAQRPFVHPIAGALTARQLLQMGAVHTDYHRRQLERLVQVLT